MTDTNNDEKLAKVIDTEANDHDAVDNLEIQVDFILGSAKIDIATLKSLKSGKTLINLPDIQLPKVKARIGDKTIAEGNLIDINGMVGFRITELK